ncbi:hypothetical protein BRPE64_CCDS08530 [Caballeronia insecticola]|uniref:Uncharacterized protein n=1 Tax=Caballeronia insecticola TaxID=758793 RepID=R4X2U5_9BURK|nr:hypothetical protein BRPE64_CCDS08530 [Caballeronia insecticola]
MQDWAQQATGGDAVRPVQPVRPAPADVARASSDALATPVIHTVD